MKEFNWSKLLKIIIAVLTALAGSIGVVSCTKKKAPSESSQARRFCEPEGSVIATDAHFASAPEGELTVIARNIMPYQYENKCTSRDV